MTYLPPIYPPISVSGVDDASSCAHQVEARLEVSPILSETAAEGDGPEVRTDTAAVSQSHGLCQTQEIFKSGADDDDATVIVSLNIEENKSTVDDDIDLSNSHLIESVTCPHTNEEMVYSPELRSEVPDDASSPSSSRLPADSKPETHFDVPPSLSLNVQSGEVRHSDARVNAVSSSMTACGELETPQQSSPIMAMSGPVLPGMISEVVLTTPDPPETGVAPTIHPEDEGPAHIAFADVSLCNGSHDQSAFPGEIPTSLLIKSNSAASLSCAHGPDLLTAANAESAPIFCDAADNILPPDLAASDGDSNLDSEIQGKLKTSLSIENFHKTPTANKSGLGPPASLDPISEYTPNPTLKTQFTGDTAMVIDDPRTFVHDAMTDSESQNEIRTTSPLPEDTQVLLAAHDCAISLPSSLKPQETLHQNSETQILDDTAIMVHAVDAAAPNSAASSYFSTSLDFAVAKTDFNPTQVARAEHSIVQVPEGVDRVDDTIRLAPQEMASFSGAELTSLSSSDGSAITLPDSLADSENKSSTSDANQPPQPEHRAYTDSRVVHAIAPDAVPDVRSPQQDVEMLCSPPSSPAASQSSSDSFLGDPSSLLSCQVQDQSTGDSQRLISAQIKQSPEFCSSQSLKLKPDGRQHAESQEEDPDGTPQSSPPLPPSSPFRSSSPYPMFSSSPLRDVGCTPPSSPPPAPWSEDNMDVSKDDRAGDAADGIVLGKRSCYAFDETAGTEYEDDGDIVMAEPRAPEGEDVHVKRMKLDLSPPKPPNPKRLTFASQQKQRKKLAGPFRSPLVDKSVIRHGLSTVYARGRTLRDAAAEKPKADAIPPQAQDTQNSQTSVPVPLISTKNRDFTEHAAKQFKSPFSTSTAASASSSVSGASFSSVKATPTIQALQAKVQMLKQAIKIKNGSGDEDDKLEALVRKWTGVGRDIAWAVWDTVKDIDPGENLSLAKGKNAWFDDEYYGRPKEKRGLDRGWGCDVGKKGSGGFGAGWGWDDSKQETGGDVDMTDGEKEKTAEEEDDEEGPEHTLGTMLRHLGIAPETLGWDEDEGDFESDV